jgi:hypothetical protein
MEFMDGGSLTEILDQYKHMQLTEPQIALILREVCWLFFFQLWFSFSISFFRIYIFLLILSL